MGLDDIISMDELRMHYKDLVELLRDTYVFHRIDVEC